jgi:hypothetical protein
MVDKIAPSQFSVDVTLYPTDDKGRPVPTLTGTVTCPCRINKDDLDSYDCRIILDEKAITPGKTARVNITFISGDEVTDLFHKSGRFFLWAGGIIGEVSVV